jgi:hypothetical protein
VLSGETGVFVLPDVPVGAHRIALAVRDLPADYDPGPLFEAMVQVDPGRSAAVTLEVWRLGSIRGTVASADAGCRESGRLHLEPSGRYTTSDADGEFSFDNLREGEYDVSFEAAPGPAACALRGPAEQRRQVRADIPTPQVQFELQAIEISKPVRRIVLQP